MWNLVWCIHRLCIIHCISHVIEDEFMTVWSKTRTQPLISYNLLELEHSSQYRAGSGHGRGICFQLMWGGYLIVILPVHPKMRLIGTRMLKRIVKIKYFQPGKQNHRIFVVRAFFFRYETRSPSLLIDAFIGFMIPEQRVLGGISQVVRQGLIPIIWRRRPPLPHVVGKVCLQLIFG